MEKIPTAVKILLLFCFIAFWPSNNLETGLPSLFQIPLVIWAVILVTTLILVVKQKRSGT